MHRRSQSGLDADRFRPITLRDKRANRADFHESVNSFITGFESVESDTCPMGFRAHGFAPPSSLFLQLAIVDRNFVLSCPSSNSRYGSTPDGEIIA